MFLGRESCSLVWFVALSKKKISATKKASIITKGRKKSKSYLRWVVNSACWEWRHPQSVPLKTLYVLYWTLQKDFTTPVYSCTCCIRNCTKADISQHKKDTSPAELSNLSKFSFFAFAPVSIVPTRLSKMNRLRSRTHHAAGISKRRFHSENASNVLQSTLHRRTITGYFGFVFQKNSVREITWLLRRHHFRKFRFQNVFRSHEKETPAFSNSSGWKGVFEKLRWCGR